MLKSVLPLLAATALLTGGALAVETTPVGKTVENFSARDFCGKSVSLADFAGNKAVVVAFWGTQCPQAKYYAPKLVELASQYQSQGVAFIAVDSNQQDSIAELQLVAQV